MMDAKISRAYDALWLWHELGELCGILRWPAVGAAAIAAAWAAGTGAGYPGIAAAAVALGAALLLLQAGRALSGAMSRRTIRRIDRMLGIRSRNQI